MFEGCPDFWDTPIVIFAPWIAKAGCYVRAANNKNV